MSTTRLLLIRHAEVEERYQGIFGGTIDMNLSARGHTQAAALARFLGGRHLDAIYASPMKRVQQTLAPLLGNGVPAPVVLPNLHEVDFGDWTGLSFRQVKEKFGAEAYTWLDMFEAGKIPNAETLEGYRARVESCVQEVLRGHPGKTVAIFCHGGVTRMILAILFNFRLAQTAAFQIEYASVTEVILKPEYSEIHSLNITPWRDLKP